MTLRSQAIVIRDETAEGANTHLRVGNLLVEMADAIAALGGGAINSAGFYSAGGELVADNDPNPVPMVENNAGFVSYKTGSGITVSYANGCYYFSGLNALKCYQVSYSFRMQSDELTTFAVNVSADNFALSYGKLFIIDSAPISGEAKSASFIGTISGLTECVLLATTPSQCIIDDINASIIELGIDV